MTTIAITRDTVDVDGFPPVPDRGRRAAAAPAARTYWSRVWQPVIAPLAEAGLQPVAVDLPGSGRSGGELTAETATVPALTAWVQRFLDAFGPVRPLLVAGHDIGGAIAQRLATEGDVARLALVNSVTYDSWPVPGVARFRDPEVVAAMTADELVGRPPDGRDGGARPAGERGRAGGLPQPLARAARRALVDGARRRRRPALHARAGRRPRRAAVPTLLLWGEDDTFQRVAFAERYAAEIPGAQLRRLPGSGHVPMESAPADTAAALAGWFAP